MQKWYIYMNIAYCTDVLYVSKLSLIAGQHFAVIFWTQCITWCHSSIQRIDAPQLWNSTWSIQENFEYPITAFKGHASLHNISTCRIISKVPNQHYTSALLMCKAMWQACYMCTLLLHNPESNLNCSQIVDNYMYVYCYRKYPKHLYYCFMLLPQSCVYMQ